MALIMKYIDSMQRWMDTYGGKYTRDTNWRYGAIIQCVPFGQPNLGVYKLTRMRMNLLAYVITLNATTLI